MQTWDPGFGMGKIWIRDKHPGFVERHDIRATLPTLLLVREMVPIASGAPAMCMLPHTPLQLGNCSCCRDNRRTGTPRIA
jgi:hypothetical protein